MMEFKNVHKDLHGNTVAEVNYALNEDSNIHETMQGFRLFLLAVGFHPDTVEQYIEAD